MERERGRVREMEREREMDGWTKGGRDGQTDRWRERGTDRQTGRETEMERESCWCITIYTTLSHSRESAHNILLQLLHICNLKDIGLHKHSHIHHSF